MNRVTEAIRGSQNWSPGRCHGMKRPAFLFLLALGVAASAAELPRRYAIELQDPPLRGGCLRATPCPVGGVPAAEDPESPGVYPGFAAKAQAPGRRRGATLANAVFVDVAPERAAELRALPACWP